MQMLKHYALALASLLLSAPLFAQPAFTDGTVLLPNAANSGGGWYAFIELNSEYETNGDRGWRVNKRDGGLLIDIQDNRVLCRGLSMPHSPRWYDGRLWLLESGRGALVTIDPDAGERTDVARVPGFARGLDFLGPVAFIGLSQLRETNAFTDIPITEDNAERQSGVWAVHIDTGQTLGLLKFTGGVREIFAVQALAGVLMPEVIAEGDLLTSSWSLPDEMLPQVQFC